MRWRSTCPSRANARRCGRRAQFRLWIFSYHAGGGCAKIWVSRVMMRFARVSPLKNGIDAPTRISLRSIRATRVASDGSPLLAGPHDARDPETILARHHAVGLGAIERLELDR